MVAEAHGSRMRLCRHRGNRDWGQHCDQCSLFGHSGDSGVWEGMPEDTLTATKLILDDMHKAIQNIRSSDRY